MFESTISCILFCLSVFAVSFAYLYSFVRYRRLANVTSFAKDNELDIGEEVSEADLLAVLVHPDDSYSKHTASSDSSDSSEGTESECSSVEYSERDDYDYSNNGGCNNGDYDCMCDTCMVFAMQSIYINGEWVDRTPDNSTFVNGTWIAI